VSGYLPPRPPARPRGMQRGVDWSSVAVIVVLLAVIVGCFALVVHINHRFDRSCHVQGGHVRTHGWGKRQTRLCLSPDGRLVDIQ
jgi:hypothetical protein